MRLGEGVRCVVTLLLAEEGNFLLDVFLSGEDLLLFLLLLRQERLLRLPFASLIGEGVESEDSGEDDLELK